MLSLCGAITLARAILAMIWIERRIGEWPVPDIVSRSASVAGACNPNDQWITAEDYPADAIFRDQEGTVRIGWRLGADGRVASCRIIESSGVSSLDNASCEAITRSACADPKSADIAQEFTRRVIWRLPE